MTPSAQNGTPHARTCLEILILESHHTDAAYWHRALQFCHVPWSAPAEEWETGLAKILLLHQHNHRVWEPTT